MNKSPWPVRHRATPHPPSPGVLKTGYSVKESRYFYVFFLFTSICLIKPTTESQLKTTLRSYLWTATEVLLTCRYLWEFHSCGTFIQGNSFIVYEWMISLFWCFTEVHLIFLTFSCWMSALSYRRNTKHLSKQYSCKEIYHFNIILKCSSGQKHE